LPKAESSPRQQQLDPPIISSVTNEIGTEIRKPKTLGDFPKFLVNAVRPYGTNDGGYTRFELDGNFDRVIENISPNWFWVLSNAKESYCAGLKSLDAETKAATLTIDVKNEPKIVGQKLFYLSSYWQAYHVWMILEEDARWEKVAFHASDAIRESISTEDGKLFQKLGKMQPGQELPNGAQVVANGWDHEHCELCNKHIDPGDYACINTAGLWVCLSCFDKYVNPRNLSFVDEL
jgi:hypothetical protein